MRIHITILLFVITLPLGAQIVGLQESYLAGDTISFTCKEQEKGISAVVTHSYGNHWIEGKPEGNRTIFHIPLKISQKKGSIGITIIGKNGALFKAKTVVLAKQGKGSSIESYCGPKHLVAGINDYSMITTTILDSYDNPYPSGTPVEFKSNIESSVSSRLKKMNGLIAYERFYAPSTSGFGALTTSHEGLSSKEFRISFYANNPEDFSISFRREHSYADGNQMVSVQTSKIQDSFSNTIENGTLVEFVIWNNKGEKYLATATTIEGVAEVELPAPDREMTWTIEAFVSGFAKSNSLNVEFLSSIKELPINSTQSTLTVGPLKGYMGQFVKEGTPVYITFRNKSVSHEFTLSTQEGFAILAYDKYLIPSAEYDVTIEVADLKKSINIILEDDKR